MLRGAVRRRVAIACIGVLAVLAPIAGSTIAHGDPIADKRKQAAEIAAKLASLQQQVETAANKYEAAQGRIAQLNQQIDAQQTKVDQAKANAAQARKQLGQYAVAAYVSGNETSSLPAVAGSSANDLGQRQGYADAAMGNRQQLIDDMQAAQKNANDQIAALDAKRAAVEQTKKAAAEEQATAQQATSQYQSLQKQVKGELARLVAEKQAAEARAAQRRAYLQAVAQARAEAAAQARAQAAAAAAASARQAQAQAAAASIPAPPASSGGGGGASAIAAPAPAPSGGGAGAAVAAAESQLGVPYMWGGESPGSGFDCSGLTQWAWAQAGVSIPRTSEAQWSSLRTVPISAIQPGDLVIYEGGGHVGMYVGGGTVIHAPHTGDVVKYASLYMSTIDAVVRP